MASASKQTEIVRERKRRKAGKAGKNKRALHGAIAGPGQPHSNLWTL